MRLARPVSLALAALLLGGCVYYNGMYNTKRLAGSARKAEREGRNFEANNLWGQVVTRAESLVARHPDSKYVDEALVLKGVALAKLNQCPSAVAPLGRASLLPAGAELTEEAALALGRCQLQLGDPAVAGAMLAKLADSHDPLRRRDARVLRARALRLSGQPDEAVAVLADLKDNRSTDERLLALAAAHRRDATLALADSMLVARDSTFRWDTVVVAVGREDPIIASGLVDRLNRRPGVAAATRARLLLDDALRLAPHDSAQAEARLHQVVQVGPETEPAQRARLRLTRLSLSRAATPEDLRAAARELGEQARTEGAVGAEAEQLRSAVTQILLALDSVAGRSPQADLYLFLAAETARDSLASPVLAASLFRTVIDSLPESPYAPKAVLAGRGLGADWAEWALGLFHGPYAASPYAAYLRGDEPYGYQELEDSLQTFAAGLAAPPAERARPGAPRTRTGPDDPLTPRERQLLQTRPRRTTPRSTTPPRRGLEP
jgi:hypothetical protein